MYFILKNINRAFKGPFHKIIVSFNNTMELPHRFHYYID